MTGQKSIIGFIRTQSLQFLSVVSFLTVIPVPAKLFDDGDVQFGSGTQYFTLAGLLMGLIVASAHAGLTVILPSLPVAIATVVCLLVISGGLHADGLSDTADGFLSARPRDEMLRIMKDSRVGAMGVIAFVSVFAFKASVVFSLPAGKAFPVIVLMPAAGRTATVLMMSFLKYARTEGGVGKNFGNTTKWWKALLSLMLFSCVAYWLAGSAGVAGAVLLVLTTILFAVWCNRKIGGYTGDTLGAVSEICELVPPLALIVMAKLF